LPTYVPGQFLTVAVPVAGAISAPGVGSGFVTRCYSLSDKPRTDAYRITVKRALAPAGAPNALPGVASSYFHDTVGEGQVLALKAPAGRFCLDPDPTVPTVLIAGGVGVTPMISMLTAANAERSERLFHLYYGVRNGADHAFRSTLENLIGGNRRLKLTVVYERPLPEDLPGRDFAYPGFIDLDLLRRTLPAGERHKFYVCGPPPMMASLIPALRGWGIPDADIAFEAFGPASFQAEQRRVPAVAESPLDVRFERSKRSLVWDGRDATLLDFAERQGIAVESGCRSGNCGSCETRIVSGAVRYLQPAAWEVAPDHCLLCVTEPTSALVLQA
jgi:ferredoxin-NADP reductase